MLASFMIREAGKEALNVRKARQSRAVSQHQIKHKHLKFLFIQGTKNLKKRTTLP